MVMRATALRANLYKVLEKVADTGSPVEVELKGKRVRIVATEPVDKLQNLTPRPEYLKVDPKSIVHMDWSSEWNP